MRCTQVRAARCVKAVANSASAPKNNQAKRQAGSPPAVCIQGKVVPANTIPKPEPAK